MAKPPLFVAKPLIEQIGNWTHKTFNQMTQGLFYFLYYIYGCKYTRASIYQRIHL